MLSSSSEFPDTLRKKMVSQSLLDRITVNSRVMVGKPTIRGLRITVEQITKALANGVSITELLEDYPDLEWEDTCYPTALNQGLCFDRKLA